MNPRLYNGKEATVNKALDGSMYPGYKLVHFVFGKNKLWWFKTQQLILGSGTAIWWVTEPHWEAGTKPQCRKSLP